MDESKLTLNRRTLVKGIAAGASIPFVVSVVGGSWAEAAESGGTLNVPLWPETTYLNSGITTAGSEAFVSPKIFDGLIGYDFGMKPKPALAESWEMSEDGKTVTFKLRPGVKWHDGEPFTSADVAFTFMEILKVHHGRGRALFADLAEVQTPDDLTAVFVLNKPAPAMMKALDSRESPIMPKHLYEGTDIMENPHNTDPVGTGAFKLASYERGVSIILEPNEEYWAEDLPKLDRMIIQFVPEPSTRTALLESGQVDVVFLNMLPALDTLRLAKEPEFEMETRGFETSPSSQLLDFNLENPILADLKVRQAIAHAIDRKWITDNVWHGLGEPGKTPLHHFQPEFNTEGVRSYEFNLQKAAEMLDEAGYKPDGNGVRFKLMLDPSPWGTESITASGYIREQLRQIGIDCEVRTQDFAVFTKTVWTDRKHDLCLYTAHMGADPTIGVQRFYWSKNFKPGTAFSNGSAYSNPKVDELLEASQTETDPEKRTEQWHEFQKIIMEEIPTLPITTISMATIANKRVKDHTVDAIGGLGNLANCWIDANA